MPRRRVVLLVSIVLLAACSGGGGVCDESAVGSVAVSVDMLGPEADVVVALHDASGARVGEGVAVPDLEVTAPSVSGNANFTSLSFDSDGNLWATTGAQMGGFVGVVGWSVESLHAARLTGGAVEAEPDWAVAVDAFPPVSGGAVNEDGHLWVTTTYRRRLCV